MKGTHPLSQRLKLLLRGPIHVPALLRAIWRIRAITTSWNDADTATAYPPTVPRFLTEQHPSDAGTNTATESSTRATDATKVEANCIAMNGMSA